MEGKMCDGDGKRRKKDQDRDHASVLKGKALLGDILCGGDMVELSIAALREFGVYMYEFKSRVKPRWNIVRDALNAYIGESPDRQSERVLALFHAICGNGLLRLFPVVVQAVESSEMASLTVCDDLVMLVEQLFRERTEYLVAENYQMFDASPSSKLLVKLVDAFKLEPDIDVVTKYLVHIEKRFHSVFERQDSLMRAARNPCLVNLFGEIVVLCERNTDLMTVCQTEQLVRFGVGLKWFDPVRRLVNLDKNKGLARIFVRTAMDMDPPQIAKAHACMNDHRLEWEFPELVLLYRRSCLEATLGKRKFGEGIFRLEKYKDYSLSSFYVGRLISMGEVYLAGLVLERLMIPPHDVLWEECPRDLYEAQRAEHERTHLSLPLGLEHVIFVNTVSSAEETASALSSLAIGDVVGLDAEWKACWSPSSTNPVSILQIATRSKVFIVDLIWLCHRAVLDASPLGLAQGRLRDGIGYMLKSRDILKLGFGFREDKRMLELSYPSFACFAEINCLLDLALAQTHKNANGGWVVEMRSKHKSGKGLKEVVFSVLGKKLDKFEQMSNWERRPLQAGQVAYAALDAYCLLMVLDVLSESGAGVEQWRRMIGVQPNDEEGETESFYTVIEKLEQRCRAESWGLERGGYTNIFSASTSDSERVRIIKLEQPNGSVKTVAACLGVRNLKQVLKSHAYLTCNHAGDEWRPMIFLTEGDAFVDEEKVVTLYGRVRRANVEECNDIFCMSPGSIGPISPKHEDIAVVMDSMVLESGLEVVCGCSQNHVIQVSSPACLLKLVRGSLADISRSSRSVKPAAIAKSFSSRSFIVDNMLGRLGKGLRIYGIDCLFTSDIPGLVESCVNNPYESVVDQDERLRIKRQLREQRKEDFKLLLKVAKEQDRMVLTTDRKMESMFKGLSSLIYVVDPGDRFTQIKQICQAFQIKLEKEEFLSRCSKCNGKGFRIVSREELLALKAMDHPSLENIPTKVFENMESPFYQCKQDICKAVFWEGTKFEHCCSKYSQFDDVV
uniref:3'-5' exonuclease domain-containing protein n=1 Tax=Mucochytrium quahogii TaxID=96639 RepID=A0A7S2WLB8_9STRA|mmetsp:Transcript_5349/g.8269  ORF Transcript_5349/g.8269 Transcript_5349/m.8269 type:complete len:1013 (+) Transcript_5349:87-3125(+)